MRINDPKADIVRDFRRLPRQNAASSPLGNSSVSKGALVVRSAEGLQVEGSERITGIWYLEGVGYVLGELDGSGYLHWTGPVDIDGTLNVNDAATLNAGLTLGASGRIYVGNITLDPVGSGGRLVSTGFLRLEAATGLQLIGNGTISDNWGVGGSLSVSGAKSFRMPHPTKEGLHLQHGSTESPVSGIEYWGDDVVGASGRCVVTLPDYFEALAKPGNRTVLVTGNGCVLAWSGIVDGTFVVTGSKGDRFSWLVKAERFGGDFEVEVQLDPLELPGSVEPGTEAGDGAIDDRDVVRESDAGPVDEVDRIGGDIESILSN